MHIIFDTKFIPLYKSGQAVDKEVLKAEFKAALRAGEGRMGNIHLFYRYFIHVKFVSYDNIWKAYLRVESGESGEFLLKEFYLMLCFLDGTESKLRFEREENAKAVLAYLKEHCPGIEIGFRKPGK